MWSGGVDMNEKKFAFVMCANNEQYEKEALYYI